MLRTRQAELAVIPPQLRALNRWVLAPSLTSIRKINGEVVSAKDQTAWMPYALAADIYLREGKIIGLVAGDGCSFVIGSCPDFIYNPGVIWRWHRTFTLRHKDEIIFTYLWGELTDQEGRFHENKIGRDISFGFDGLAAPMIGYPVGLMDTYPSPFSWKRIPIQHRSIKEELQAQINGSEHRIKMLRQELAEAKQCAHNKK